MKKEEMEKILRERGITKSLLEKGANLLGCDINTYILIYTEMVHDFNYYGAYADRIGYIRDYDALEQ